MRQKEEQLQAAQQQSSLLAAELRDASAARDRTMSELYHMKLETDALRKAKTDAQAQCARLERLVEQMKAEEAKQEVTEKNGLRRAAATALFVMVYFMIQKIKELEHFFLLPKLKSKLFYAVNAWETENKI